MSTQEPTPNAAGGASVLTDGLGGTVAAMTVYEQQQGRELDAVEQHVFRAAYAMGVLNNQSDNAIPIGRLRDELQQARHDLMVRATVKDERIDTLDAAGHRLALELECLLLDTKDLPTVCRWWDTGMVALEEWRRLFPYNGPRLGD